MKSKNIIFPAAKQVAVVEETVAPLQDDEVLVRAKRSLMSTGTETRCLKGVFDPGTNWASWVQYPFKPGYSMSGEVIDVGRSVDRFEVGDRVSFSQPHCQYFNAPADHHRLIKIPAPISDEEASWVSLAMTTQLGVRRAELKLGARVGVIGLGLLGQLVVQYLQLLGVRELVAIDTIESRLTLARKGGATHSLATDASAAKAPIKEITHGRMLDVVFDVTGHPAVLSAALPLVHDLGQVIIVGDTTTPTKQHLGTGVVSGSKSVAGIHASMYPKSYSVFNPWTFEEMSSLFFDYLEKGRMNVKVLKTHTFRVDEAAEAYAMLSARKEPAMGVLFDWEAQGGSARESAPG